MIELNGTPGELRFTVEVKRKDTGKVETFEMVGYIDPEKLKEPDNGGNTLDSGA